MKTVVITGSSRGFGFCLAREFRRIGCNVVLSAVNEENLRKAEAALKNVGPGDAKVVRTVCDVTDSDALQRLWDLAKETFGAVDIWVNNAGVNSPDKPVWELTEKEIGFLLDTDLKGTVYGSKVAFAGMKEQGVWYLQARRHILHPLPCQRKPGPDRRQNSRLPPDARNHDHRLPSYRQRRQHPDRAA